jgi:hypothetical protein
MRLPIKSLVCIGTEFIENNNPCVVTRVTDLHFDTLDKVNRTVKVRSLKSWENEKFMNSISACTGLLKIRESSSIRPLAQELL